MLVARSKTELESASIMSGVVDNELDTAMGREQVRAQRLRVVVFAQIPSPVRVCVHVRGVAQLSRLARPRSSVCMSWPCYFVGV